MLKRVCLLIKSIFCFIKYKIQYRNKIDLKIINSFKGKIRIEINDSSKCKIGDFLMTRGPFYLKSGGNAKINIGNNVFFNHNCSITALNEITIGDNCNFANNLVIVDHNHKIGEKGVIEGFESAPVKIGSNVWCGANVTILQGVEIGDGSVVAAGAVVTKNIPSYELWGGVPAKKMRNLTKESNQNDS